MTETTQQKIAVMQAYLSRKKIRRRLRHSDEWEECPDPLWDWTCYDYEVDEESTPPSEHLMRRLWLLATLTPGMLVRQNSKHKPCLVVDVSQKEFSVLVKRYEYPPRSEDVMIKTFTYSFAEEHGFEFRTHHGAPWIPMKQTP